MLLRLRNAATAADRDALRALAAELGYGARFLDEDERLLELRARGEKGAPADRSRLEELGCVEAVLDAADAPELFQRTPDRDQTVVRAAGAVFGGGALSLVAGPCAVEGADDLLRLAEGVRRRGAALLRGGAFKPRTSPHAFQGLGEEGLRHLAAARAETGLGIVTEVLDPRDVGRVAEVADMLQIGSRSMANAALLTEVGRVGVPVLLKRGMAATVREFLLAAEYVLDAGNGDVVLCERGIRGFDHFSRGVLDVGAIAHLKNTTHLPVVVDPSHAAGRPDLVVPLAKAGVAAGADGVLVEVHHAPGTTRSDGAQAISLGQLEDLAGAVRALAELDGRRLVTPTANHENPHEEAVR